jgi:hypothetical protein
MDVEERCSQGPPASALSLRARLLLDADDPEAVQMAASLPEAFDPQALGRLVAPLLPPAQARVLSVVAHRLAADAVPRTSGSCLARALETCVELERRLALLFAAATRGATRPLLLKDLLAAPELESVVGREMVVVLTALLVEPRGLNLRNLAWHGFLTPAELAMHSELLAQILDALPGPATPVPAEPCRPCAARLTASTPLARLVRHALASSDRADLEDLLSGCPGMALRSVVPEMLDALSAGTPASLATALALALVSLEALLRWAFTTANGIPHRYVCADPPEYFITLQDVVASHLPDASAAPNQLLSDIGPAVKKIM